MSGSTRTDAGKRLLAELSESPLPGARYARDVVSLRLAEIEDEAAGPATKTVTAGLGWGDSSVHECPPWHTPGNHRRSLWDALRGRNS